MKLNKCLGIYLSDRAFSISHMVTKGSKYEVDLVHWEKIKLSADEPDEVKFAYFSKRIKEILKEKKIGTRDAVFSISGMNVFNRKRKLPNVPDRKLKGIVRYEAFQVIPFPYEHIYLEYFPYRDPEESSIDVWIMAVKKDLVQNLLRRLKKIGLRTSKLEVSSLGLFNFTLVDNRDNIDDDTFATIYFGLSSVDISIGDKEQLGFTRSSPFAGNELAKALAKKKQISYLDAEELRDKKIVALLDGMEEADVPEGYNYSDSLSLKPVMERMVADVRRSIDFYISQPDGVAVEKLFVTGPICRVPFFKEFVEENLGISVEMKDGLNEELFTVKEGFSSQIGPAYASLALAFNGVHEPHTYIDFLPPEVKNLRNIRENKVKVGICAAVVLINIAIAGTLGTTEVGRLQYAISRMDRSIQEGQAVAQEYDNAVNTMKSVDRYLQYLASFKKGEDVLKHSDFPLLILQEINENIPLDSVWVESFRFTDENKAFVVAKTVDLSRFWSVFDQISNHPMLDIRVLSRRDEDDAELERTVERFSLELTVVTGDNNDTPQNTQRNTRPRR